MEKEEKLAVETSYEQLAQPLIDLFAGQPLLQGSVFILLTILLASPEFNSLVQQYSIE